MSGANIESTVISLVQAVNDLLGVTNKLIAMHIAVGKHLEKHGENEICDELEKLLQETQDRQQDVFNELNIAIDHLKGTDSDA